MTTAPEPARASWPTSWRRPTPTDPRHDRNRQGRFGRGNRLDSPGAHRQATRSLRWPPTAAHRLNTAAQLHLLRERGRCRTTWPSVRATSRARTCRTGPWRRWALSWTANTYARWPLGIGNHDITRVTAPTVGKFCRRSISTTSNRRAIASSSIGRATITKDGFVVGPRCQSRSRKRELGVSKMSGSHIRERWSKCRSGGSTGRMNRNARYRSNRELAEAPSSAAATSASGSCRDASLSSSSTHRPSRRSSSNSQCVRRRDLLRSGSHPRQGASIPLRHCPGAGDLAIARDRTSNSSRSPCGNAQSGASPVWVASVASRPAPRPAS